MKKKVEEKKDVKIQKGEHLISPTRCGFVMSWAQFHRIATRVS